MTVDKAEFDIILETVLEAVSEQFALPIALALETLTAAACKDPDTQAQVAQALQTQADSCATDVAGRALLQALATLAAAPTPPSPSDVQSALRTQLRLIQGSRQD